MGFMNLTFENLVPAKMDPIKAGVAPNLWDKSEFANYTLIFEPRGFEINMVLDVYVEKRIGIPDDFGKNNSCLGVRGTDKLELACKVDRRNHKIHFSDLWESKETKPDVVEIIF
jgi:hypothetical protein